MRHADSDLMRAANDTLRGSILIVQNREVYFWAANHTDIYNAQYHCHCARYGTSFTMTYESVSTFLHHYHFAISGLNLQGTMCI